jgi:hypothetical protein
MTDRVREWLEIRIYCQAPTELIGRDIAPEILERYADSLPLPCEGDGHLGTWCSGCYWSDIGHLDYGEGEP